MSDSPVKETRVRPVTVTPARRKMSASDERRFFRWITHSVGDRGFPVYNEHVRGERMGRRAQINNWWFAFAFATSFAGLALGVLASELSFHPGSEPQDGEEAFGSVTVPLLCWLTAALSFVTIGALAVHHDGAAALALQEGRSRGAGAESAGAGGAGDAPGFLQRLHLAGRRGAFLRDAGLHLLLPWPPLAPRVVEVWDDVLDAPSRYTLLDLLVLAMLARVVLLPRFAAIFHPLDGGTARIWGRLVDQEIDTWFIVRVLLNDSYAFLLAFWAVAVLAFSYGMFVFERAYNQGSDGPLLHDQGLASFPNCVWFIIITMATIGYGDLAPVTRMGRIVAVVSCFAAVVLFALTVNIVLKLLTLDFAEENLLRVADRADARRSLHTAAARLIEAVYARSPMYHRLRARGGAASPEAYVELPLLGPPRAPAAPGARGAWRVGRALSALGGGERAALRWALRDAHVQRWLRESRRWRLVVRKIRAADFANEQEQSCRLISAQARVERKVGRLAGMLDRIAEATAGAGGGAVAGAAPRGDE